MDPKRYDTALRVFVLATIVAGHALILYGSPVVRSVGVLLVIVGLVSLIAVVHNALMADPA